VDGEAVFAEITNLTTYIIAHCCWFLARNENPDLREISLENKLCG